MKDYKDIPPLYEVEWLDTGLSGHGWTNREKASKARTAHVISVGYLFEETGQDIKLTESICCDTRDPHELNDLNDLGCIKVIAKTAIRAQRALRKGRQVKP